MIEKFWNSVKSNHFAHMAICCLLPVILIFALQFFGITGWWVFGLALAVCVGSHLVMAFFSPGEGKSCH